MEQERGSRLEIIIDGFGAGGSGDADEDSADEMRPLSTKCVVGPLVWYRFSVINNEGRRLLNCIDGLICVLVAGPTRSSGSALLSEER